MYSISILEETKTSADMAYTLRNIADQIENGYTKGNYPSWLLSGEEPNRDIILVEDEQGVGKMMPIPPHVGGKRQVIVIFGLMDYDEDSCIIVKLDKQFLVDIDIAENWAHDMIDQGYYDDFVIPELYESTINW